PGLHHAETYHGWQFDPKLLGERCSVSGCITNSVHCRKATPVISGGFPMTQRRDPWLITKLFDLTFSRFVALSLVRIAYVLLMIAGLAALAFVITYLFQIGRQDTTIAALLLLLLAPIIYLPYLVLLRLICEVLIVVFAMAEDIEELRARLAE